MATPIQSYAGQATVASKVMPTTEPPWPISGRQAVDSDFREYAETCTACATSGHGPVEELAAEQRLGVAVGDRVHDAVEAVDVLADQVGQPLEVLGVGDVELDHRRLGSGSRLGDPLGDAERPAEVRDQHGRALLLRDLRATAKPIEVSIVTPATRIRLPSRMPMSSSPSCRVVRLVGGRVGQWPMPRPPSTGITAPVT